MARSRFKVAAWYPEFLEAKPLELFANLEESESAFNEAHPKFKNEKRQPVTVAEFRKVYPKFAPDGWWTYRSDADAVTNQFPGKANWESMQWQTAQANLRSAWDGGFPLEPRDLIILLTIVFDPEELNEGERPLLGNILLVDPQSSYYKSLVWLNSQPWRARSCTHCKRRFIASWQSSEHCSQHCAAIALREYKRKFRRERASQYNKNRKEARAKEKQEI